MKSVPAMARGAAATLALGHVRVAGAAPLNYFLHSHGPASAATMRLGWVFTSVAVALCLTVAALLAYATWRPRGAHNEGAVRDSAAALRWIAIGTSLSGVVLFMLASYALSVLGQVGSPPSAPARTVTVTGYDWWWRVDYAAGGGDGGQHGDGVATARFTTANEFHIPVGMPVRLLLNSPDVIHAFWVPQLAARRR